MNEQTAELYTRPTAMPPEVVMVWVIIALLLLIPIIAGMWKVFQKAGKPGWAAIVPIYNTIVLLEVTGKPIWWVVFLLLGGVVPFIGPVVVLVFSILIAIELSKRFGKGVGMTLLQIFLPFIAYPVLGFGSAQYRVPGAPTNLDGGNTGMPGNPGNPSNGGAPGQPSGTVPPTTPPAGTPTPPTTPSATE